MTPSAQDHTPRGLPVRVALVRHELAPGGDHLDLFVGPADCPDANARVARCWRLPLAAWDSEGLACGRFGATEIEPHRAEYLVRDTEVTLTDGRGRVVPLVRGAGDQRSPSTIVVLGRHLTLAADSVVIEPA